MNVDSLFREKYLIFSVVGFHAGESEEEIFNRKRKEIADVGESFWLINSFKARTEIIQKFCRTALEDNKEIYCIFLEASQRGSAKPTKFKSHASEFSSDKINWSKIPKKIKVTGRINKNTTALILKTLEFNKNTNVKFDLWNYSDFLNDSAPIKFTQGASTVCAVRNYKRGMKSRFRRVVAFGKLKNPFAVWLR